MSRVLPILFNTEMVRAILDGRKIVTRRVVPINIVNQFDIENDNKTVCAFVNRNTGDSHESTYPCRYQVDDILYVREKFCIGRIDEGDCIEGVSDGLFISQCVNENDYIPYEYCIRHDIGIEDVIWHPSIHMPKEAARIWLRVTGMRVERLQDISFDEIFNEGTILEQDFRDNFSYGIAKDKFRKLWDSTIKKQDLDSYGWNANPWVWVIEFERCEKHKSEIR